MNSLPYVISVLFLSCTFAGIDVSSSFLEEAKTNILKHVPGMNSSQIVLVEADYLEGLKSVRQTFKDRTLCILWLGSSVGNLSSNFSYSVLFTFLWAQLFYFTDSEAVEFFKKVEESAGDQIQILLCAGERKDMFLSLCQLIFLPFYSASSV